MKIKDFKELVSDYRTAFFDKVDGLWLLIMTAVAIYEATQARLVPLFIIFYVQWLLRRKGFFINALNKYVEDPRAREYLKLPPLKKD